MYVSQPTIFVTPLPLMELAILSKQRMLAIPVAHLGGAADLPTVLPMITTNPAKALGLEGYGIAVGNNADMVLLDTTSYGDAIIDLPIKSVVVKSGRITVETEKTVKFGLQ
ncbi:amidohydrolase family protein [Erysipelothrix sp. D19-032]